MTLPDPTSLLWMVIIGGIWSFFMAWGIGANDVANSFATSVGSKTLTLRQALIVAAIFEFSGAFFVGSHVADTIRKGIVDVTLYQNDPTILMIGMFSALIGGSLWLWIATFIKLPVSTTHSIVGAVIGFSLVEFGADGIQWEAVGFIVLSWVLSPLLSGILVLILFSIIRSAILRRKNALTLSLLFLPLFYFITCTIIAFSIIYEGTPALNLDTLEVWVGFLISVGIGLFSAFIAAIIIVPVVRRYVNRDRELFPYYTMKQKLKFLFCFGAYSNIHYSEVKEEILNKPLLQETDEKRISQLESDDEKRISQLESNLSIRESPTGFKRVIEILKIIFFGHEGKTKEIYAHSEIYPQNVEETFSAMQVLTACFASFSHGANDVSNAIGPYATIVALYNGSEVAQKSPVATWVLVLGSIGIVIGLAMWGYRVIQTLGEKMTKVTPSRGFVMEFGTATTVVIASRLKLPVSTTHCHVGSVTGVGLLDGYKAINWWLFANIFASWVVTLPFTGLSSALVFVIFRAILI